MLLYYMKWVHIGQQTCKKLHSALTMSSTCNLPRWVRWS